jgi:Uma2 family endonuclease
MIEKLENYFRAGVELVWYVDPAKKTVRVYTSPNDSRLVRESGTIDGGTVLPGFLLRPRDLFADPLAEDSLM